MVTCEGEPCSGSYNWRTWTKVGRARKRKKKLGPVLNLRRCLCDGKRVMGREALSKTFVAVLTTITSMRCLSLMWPQWQNATALVVHSTVLTKKHKRRSRRRRNLRFDIPRCYQPPFPRCRYLHAVLKKSPITNFFFLGGNETRMQRSRVDRPPR